MNFYREVRVRPVVRYIVTLYERTEDAYGRESHNSQGMGEFDNSHTANLTGAAIYRDLCSADEPMCATAFDPARQLKIDWTRGPGEPQEAIQWHLVDVDRPTVVVKNCTTHNSPVLQGSRP